MSKDGTYRMRIAPSSIEKGSAPDTSSLSLSESSKNNGSVFFADLGGDGCAGRVDCVFLGVTALASSREAGASLSDFSLSGELRVRSMTSDSFMGKRRLTFGVPVTALSSSDSDSELELSTTFRAREPGFRLGVTGGKCSESVSLERVI